MPSGSPAERGVSDADTTGPFWSPDRSLIAYGRDAELFVVDVSTGESTMVTQEPEEVVGPGGGHPTEDRSSSRRPTTRCAPLLGALRRPGDGSVEADGARRR